MDITKLIGGLLTPDNVNTISDRVGIKNSQAKSLIAMGLPVLLNALKTNAQDSTKAQSIDIAASEHNMPTDIMDLISGAGQADGQKILGHILGQNKNTVQGQVAQQAGVSDDKASSILGMLAPMIMGSLGETKKSQGLDTVGTTQAISQASHKASDPSIMDSLLTSMLDKNNDGSYKDDLMTMGMDWVKSQFTTKK